MDSDGGMLGTRFLSPAGFGMTIGGQIDRLVCVLYGLTEEEIAIVEGL